MFPALILGDDGGLPRRHLLGWALLSMAPLPARAAAVGRVYIYAPRSTPARSWLPVLCGGTAVAALREGRFFAVLLAPGRYTFSVEDGMPKSVEVQAGSDLYLRLDWNHHVGRPPIPALSGVRAEDARREMRYLSYIESKHIRSASVPQSDPREPEEQQLKRRNEPQGSQPISSSSR